MLIILGLVAVFAAVLGGFVLERGNVLVLLQPAELLIICGSAGGILLVSNPPSQIRRMLAGIRELFRPGKYSQPFYLATLKMLYELFLFGRRAGPTGLENHIEDPEKSAIFQRYPEFLADSEALAFLCDSFRIVIAAGITAPELDRLMSSDMAVQRRERQQPVSALSTLADSLPGLGIVAAVLGVVVTMQALGGEASEIGQKVAAALVGTFLGILLCYGVTGPLAFHMECRNQGRNEYLEVLRVAVSSYLGGASPIVAAEFARRSIPAGLRPSFTEMEEATRRSAVNAIAPEAHA
jgi:chemotaxis protein MotA